MAISILLLAFLFLLPNDSMQDCLDLKPDSLPESFLFENSPKEWFIPMRSNPSRTEIMDTLGNDEIEMEGGGPKTICLSVGVEAESLAGNFKLECSFEEAGELLCDIQPGDDVPMLARTMMPKRVKTVTVKTDGSTYAAMVACIGGHSNTWMVVSSVPEISQEIQQEILEHFKSIGIDTATGEDGVDFSLSETEIEKGGC